MFRSSRLAKPRVTESPSVKSKNRKTKPDFNIVKGFEPVVANAKDNTLKIDVCNSSATTQTDTSWETQYSHSRTVLKASSDGDDYPPVEQSRNNTIVFRKMWDQLNFVPWRQHPRIIKLGEHHLQLETCNSDAFPLHSTALEMDLNRSSPHLSPIFSPIGSPKTPKQQSPCVVLTRLPLSLKNQHSLINLDESSVKLRPKRLEFKAATVNNVSQWLQSGDSKLNDFPVVVVKKLPQCVTVPVKESPHYDGPPRKNSRRCSQSLTSVPYRNSRDDKEVSVGGARPKVTKKAAVVLERLNVTSGGYVDHKANSCEVVSTGNMLPESITCPELPPDNNDENYILSSGKRMETRPDKNREAKSLVITRSKWERPPLSPSQQDIRKKLKIKKFPLKTLHRKLREESLPHTPQEQLLITSSVGDALAEKGVSNLPSPRHLPSSSTGPFKSNRTLREQEDSYASSKQDQEEKELVLSLDALRKMPWRDEPSKVIGWKLKEVPPVAPGEDPLLMIMRRHRK